MSKPTTEDVYRAAIQALDESFKKTGKIGPKTGFIRTLEILDYKPKPFSAEEERIENAFDVVFDKCDEKWSEFKLKHNIK
jgi:hypothetical protein